MGRILLMKAIGMIVTDYIFPKESFVSVNVLVGASTKSATAASLDLVLM